MEEGEGQQQHVGVEAVVDGEAAERACQHSGQDGDGADGFSAPEDGTGKTREQRLELCGRLESDRAEGARVRAAFGPTAPPSEGGMVWGPGGGIGWEAL